MTITLDTNLIQSAIRAKAPVIGISVPNHAPIRLLRSRLRASLKGLTLVTAEYEDGKLKITAGGERVKATRTYYPMQRNEASKLLDKWAKSERTKLAKPKPASPSERKLQDLRKKLDKLTFRPQNPAIASGLVISEYKRRQFLDWKLQKQLRRQFNSKSEFSMAILSGKIEAQMSNPAQHYDWQRSEPEWGAERYRRSSLNSEERHWIKEQIAVVLQRLHPGVHVTRISSFARQTA